MALADALKVISPQIIETSRDSERPRVVSKTL